MSQIQVTPAPGVKRNLNDSGIALPRRDISNMRNNEARVIAPHDQIKRRSIAINNRD
jgi:hypothetical protein